MDCGILGRKPMGFDFCDIMIYEGSDAGSFVWIIFQATRHLSEIDKCHAGSYQRSTDSAAFRFFVDGVDDTTRNNPYTTLKSCQVYLICLEALVAFILSLDRNVICMEYYLFHC